MTACEIRRLKKLAFNRVKKEQGRPFSHQHFQLMRNIYISSLATENGEGGHRLLNPSLWCKTLRNIKKPPTVNRSKWHIHANMEAFLAFHLHATHDWMLDAFLIFSVFHPQLVGRTNWTTKDNNSLSWIIYGHHNFVRPFFLEKRRWKISANPVKVWSSVNMPQHIQFEFIPRHKSTACRWRRASMTAAILPCVSPGAHLKSYWMKVKSWLDCIHLLLWMGKKIQDKKINCVYDPGAVPHVYFTKIVGCFSSPKKCYQPSRSAT